MPGRFRSLAVNSAVVLGSIFFALLLAEVCLRLINYDRNVSRAFMYHPEFGWVDDPAALARIDPSDPRIDDLGLKRELKSKVALVIGDSFTVAPGLLYRDNFAAVLEELLGNEWSVVGLAAGGWGTAQELIALRSRGLALEPNVVILQVFPTNDVCNNAIELRGVCDLQDLYRPYFLISESDGRPVEHTGPMVAIRKASVLAGLIENVLNPGIMRPRHDLTPEEFHRIATAYRDRNANRIGLGGWREVYIGLPKHHQPAVLQQAWRITESLFREIGATLKRRDIPLISIVVPYRDTLTEERWGRMKGNLPAHSTPDYGDRYAEDLLSKISNQTVSMRDFFARNPHFVGEAFLPGAHFNELGNCLVAVLLYKAMTRAGLLDDDAAHPGIAAEQHCAGGKRARGSEPRGDIGEHGIGRYRPT